MTEQNREPQPTPAPVANQEELSERTLESVAGGTTIPEVFNPGPPPFFPEPEIPEPGSLL